jgi:hypothetical protein
MMSAQKRGRVQGPAGNHGDERPTLSKPAEKLLGIVLNTNITKYHQYMISWDPFNSTKFTTNIQVDVAKYLLVGITFI